MAQIPEAAGINDYPHIQRRPSRQLRIAALPLPQLRPYIQRTDPSPLVRLHHRGQWQAFDEVLNVRVSPATPGTCQ